MATPPDFRYDKPDDATGGLFRRYELGISLEAAFADVDAFILFLFRDPDANSQLEQEPDDETRNEDPGEDRSDAD